MNLTLNNRFIEELPGDPDPTNRSRLVQNALWSPVQPTPVAKPQLLSYSREVMALLGWQEHDSTHPNFAALFAGNHLLPGMQPYATCYGGHQFGHWAGQLGDGRAINLGEIINSSGERWELQLKGAGPTPYSRRADGRAVLRSSVREFLCSEAMHHLGIPTTRALSLVATGDWVMRDMFYDGNPQAEPGAIVCRVAPSFLRFGHFELPTQRRDMALLEKLVDFTLTRDYPHLTGPLMQRREQWFIEICTRTAHLIAHWMRVGFVHGVMNTDNMSILGLTIDYGPYGWLEDYEPNWTPNTTDEEGRRYCYGQQPYIGYWNLQRLGEALAPLIPDIQVLQAGLQAYTTTYQQTFSTLLAAKFGFQALNTDDLPWLETTFEQLQQSEVDMTLFFRRLADINPQQPNLAPLLPAFYRPELLLKQQPAWDHWLQRYASRLQQDHWPADQRRAQMNATNPCLVLRNYLAQQAIDQATLGDNQRLTDLLEALRHPYDEQPRYAAFMEKRPEWARHKAGCSMLSCSS